MIRLSQERTKTLLAIHGWSAVFLGLLLYAVIVTGVASVFESEISDWSGPLEHGVENPFPAGTGAMLEGLARDIDPSYHEEMFVFPGAGDRLVAFFHRHEKGEDGKPMERGVRAEFDPRTMQLISRHEGTDEEVFHEDTASALSHFMVDMHVRLHVPDPWGLLLTGILGLAMMVAAVTGFVIHRHLIKELFTLRRQKDKLLTARDVHVVAGTWNLPFAFILAFTGSYFSFGSSFAIPAVAMVAFGGDQEKLIETVVGNPPKTDPTPAPMSDLDRVIADVRERSGSEPSFLSVQHWGRADALVTAFMELPQDRLTGPTYLYSGATGEFLQAKPSLGLVPSTGGLLFDLMAPLHFGNFAGVFSKAVWFALGFAGAYVTLTGLSLWTQRRRGQRGWDHLARAVVWVGFGLPLALTATAYVFFPLRAAGVGGAVHDAMMAAFLAVAALSGVLAWALRDTARTRALLIAATAVALLGLPLIRIACGGLGWGTALERGLPTIPALDLAFVAAGLLSAWALRSTRRSAAAQADAGTPTDPVPDA